MLLFSSTAALQPSRRDFLYLACSAPASCSAAVISAPLCEQGQGDGCAELAGDSAYIRELQSRSSQNREERDKAALERYSVNNFGDYFAAGFPPRKLVRHKDGKYEALTDAELEAGIKEGKIAKGYFSTGYGGRNPHYFIE